MTIKSSMRNDRKGGSVFVLSPTRNESIGTYVMLNAGHFWVWLSDGYLDKNFFSEWLKSVFGSSACCSERSPNPDNDGGFKRAIWIVFLIFTTVIKDYIFSKTQLPVFYF